MKSDKTVRISTELNDLIGIGLEYLIDMNGNVLMRFVDGNIVDDSDVIPNDETTKSL